LRAHIRFIQEDAPAIAASLDPNAPVDVTVLNKEYVKLNESGEHRMTVQPLAVAGKEMVKSPAVKIAFDEDNGVLIVSQLLTSGRLAEGFDSDGLYGVRYDPAAVQMVLNMIETLLEE
jgi:beta-galactosidase